MTRRGAHRSALMRTGAALIGPIDGHLDDRWDDNECSLHRRRRCNDDADVVGEMKKNGGHRMAAKDLFCSEG